MELLNFIKGALKETMLTLAIGAVAFVLTLVMTLNFTMASLILLLFVAAAVFQKSFSRGWLFLFLIVIMFPSVKISSGMISISDLLLTLLSLIGMISIIFEDMKMSVNKLTFYFLLLLLSGGSIIVFGKYFGCQIDSGVWFVSFRILFYWLILTTFHYFFQTQKRLRRFFSLIIAAGTAHSIFGIIAFLLGWQSLDGFGISIGKIQYLSFSTVTYQVNGFLGDGYALRVGENALAPLLLISIPITIGLIINTKKKLRTERPLSVIEEKIKLLDSAYSIRKANFFKEKVIAQIKNGAFKGATLKFFKSKELLILLAVIQVIALALTFSHTSLIALGVGLFTIGILLRNKRLLSIVATGLIVLTLVLPSFRSSITTESKKNIDSWFRGFEQIQSNLFWGNGWRIEKQSGVGSQEVIHNSYLFIWNNFGFLGIIIFIGLLYQYFRDIHGIYIRSDGAKRIWLVMIISIYFEFLLLGLTSNTLLFGPAALVFWILYGAALNLKRRQIVFGITETRLMK